MTRLIIAIGLFLLLPFMSIGRVSVSAAVLINEICPKECGDEKTQWVELYNNGENPVSLEGWKLQNTSGNNHTFTIPGGYIINPGPGNFWAFDQSLTSIQMDGQGDTVILLDSGNNQKDSQSYPSILGYNTSMGRSVDGSGTWAMCTSWTKNLANICPAPTVTPTPLPTQVPKLPASTPSPTLTPTPTAVPRVSTPTPTSIFTAANQSAQSQVLGLTDKPATSADLKKSTVRWYLGVASLCIAALALLTLVVRWYSRKRL